MSEGNAFAFKNVNTKRQQKETMNLINILKILFLCSLFMYPCRNVEIDNPEHVIAPGMSLGKREIIREGPGMLGGLTR